MAPYRLLPGLLLLTACFDKTPSSGECSGRWDGMPISALIDPDTSYFFRDDDILLDADGPFVMNYGTVFRVEGTFDDLPNGSYLGTYPTIDKRLSRWVILYRNFGITDVANLTLTTAMPSRVLGQFSLADTLTCTFDLRRAYERDTDD